MIEKKTKKRKITYQKALGETLRFIRRRVVDVTLVQLANANKRSPAFLSENESGKKDITDEVIGYYSNISGILPFDIIQFAEAYHADPDQVLIQWNKMVTRVLIDISNGERI